MASPFQVVDESNDRKYFTIVPNYIINHSTYFEQSLYLVMKRLAGESGTCFATQKTIAKMMGCSQPSVTRTIEKLIKRNWIKCIGTRPGKTRPVKEYRLIDLWKFNVNYYQEKKIVKPQNISLQAQNKKDSKTTEYKIVKPQNIEEEPIGRRKTALTSKDAKSRKIISFKREDYLKVLEEYQKLKKMELQGKEFDPVMQTIKTMFLSGRNADQIIAVMGYIAHQDYIDWTIRTVKMKMAEVLPRVTTRRELKYDRLRESAIREMERNN